MAFTNEPLRSNDASNSTLGAILRSERISHGTDLEHFARRTKVAAGTLSRLEADDFSGLTPFYARRFALAYARELRIPTARIERFLPAAESGFSTTGFEYLNNPQAGTDVVAAARPKTSTPPRRRRHIILKLAGVALFCAVGLQVATMWKKIERLKPGSDELAQSTIMSIPLIADARTSSGSEVDASLGHLQKADAEWVQARADESLPPVGSDPR